MLNETVVTFPEAAKRLPTINGKNVHASSVWRWARKGVRGVYLESRRLGGRYLTSLEALERFTEKLAEVSREAGSERLLKQGGRKQ